MVNYYAKKIAKSHSKSKFKKNIRYKNPTYNSDDEGFNRPELIGRALTQLEIIKKNLLSEYYHYSYKQLETLNERLSYYIVN
jgi:hypothetical protein